MENELSDFALLIVLFNPNAEERARVERAAQSFNGVVVDNSPVATYKTANIGCMRYVSLGKNKGIAAAQNAGLEFLTENPNIKYVVFFDQDSQFPDTYPQAITGEYKRIDRMLGGKLASLGPVIVDKEDGEVYKSAFHKESEETGGFLPKTEIISSGSCIALERLRSVGTFDDSFFIDFVDTEWCFRAESMGFRCGQTTRLRLAHKVGKEKLHIGKHIILISAPVRYYYQYRNFLLLLTKDYVPVSFKFFKGCKFLLRIFYFPFIRGGLSRWRYMLRGVKAGLSVIIKHKRL